MKIAIFGGTFDPFTAAHKEIVRQLLEYVKVDKVIVSPTVTNWYRNKEDVWLTDKQRLECCSKMLNYAVSVNPYDIELKASFDSKEDQDEFVKNWHYYDTLCHIRSNTNCSRVYDSMYDEKNEFYTVIGSDQLEFFKSWYRWEDVLKLSKLIVVNNRNGNHVDSDIPHIDIEIAEEFWNVSATEIRAKYKVMKDGFQEYLKSVLPPPPDELLCRTPIFDVVQKPAPYVDLPEFRPVAVKSPDWVTVIAEKDGKFCCVKQLRYGLMKDCEEFVAGMVDEGEAAFYAAKRELHEETGINLLKGVSELMYLGKTAANPAFMTNFMHYFYVNLDDAEFVQEDKKLDKHEKLAVYWKDKKEVMKKWFDGESVFLSGAMLKMIQLKIIDLQAIA